MLQQPVYNELKFLVQDQAYNYYGGGEYMIAGKVSTEKPNDELKSEIHATSAKGPERFIFNCPLPHIPEPFPEVKEYSPLPPQTIGGFVERTWSYLTIKKLLEDADFGTENEAEAKALRDKALQLSLKVSKIFFFQFVTN